MIVILEGPWGSGKSTIAAELLVKFPRAIFIPEPDHLVQDIGGQEIERWYWEQFSKREEEAKKLSLQGNIVILERCRLSVMAYLYSIEDFERLEQYRSKSEAQSSDIFVILKPAQPRLDRSRKMIERYYKYCLDNQNFVLSKYYFAGDLEEVRDTIVNAVET